MTTGPTARAADQSPGADGALSGRRLLVGVTGGIAAYKACTIVSTLVQRGAHVTVAMTPSARQFVTPLSFEALSGRPVLTDVWESVDHADPQHIRLADTLDAAIVAPCTMSCLARLATGQADDIVTLVLSAVERSRTPVLLAPSMNDVMWSQPSTQRNVRTLEEDGFTMIGPGEGWQACRHVGRGRMSEPGEIIESLVGLLATNR